jgi:hypothetical protein
MGDSHRDKAAQYYSGVLKDQLVALSNLKTDICYN